MKKSSRVLSVVLCVLLTVAVMAMCQVVTFAATDGDYSYTFTANGKATITKYNGTATAVSVPATVGGSYSVTAIGDRAFDGNKTVKSISLPAGVAKIGNGAFRGCSALESISLPTAYTTGDAVFMDCSALKGINLSGAQSLGDGVLSGCSALESVTLFTVDAPVEGAGYMAALFDGIANPGNPGFPATLKNVTVTNDESIETKAFAGLTSLEKVTFNQDVSSIGVSAFEGCTSLVNVNFDIIAERIEERAFYGCSSLKKLDMSARITSGGTVYTVKALGASAFENCAALETLTFNPIDGAKQLSSVGKNALKGTKWYNDKAPGDVILEKVYIGYKGNTDTVVIPAAALYIADSAFEGNKALKNLTVPANVVYVGENVLKNTALGTLTAAYIGDNAAEDRNENPYLGYLFGGTKSGDNGMVVPASLHTVNLTGGATVQAGLFNGCKYLKTVSLPETVTAIEELAFANCPALTTLNYNAANATVATDAFDNTVVKNYTLGNTVKVIPTYLFTGHSGLTSIVIPESITTISDRAFAGCYNLQTVEFNAVNCTNVAAGAFDYCHRLHSVKLGNAVAHIPANLYSKYGSGELTELTIPENVTSIAPGAFKNCVSLKTIHYNAKNCVIGEEAFVACSKLSKVVFGDKVTAIPTNLYTGNTAIKKITVPAHITRIDDRAFRGCTNLEQLVLPENLNDIGATILHDTKWYDMQADGGVYLNTIFYGYKGELPANGKVTLVDGTTAIVDEALKRNAKLTAIVIPDSVTYIGKEAFALTTATVNYYDADTASYIIGYATANSLPHAEIARTVCAEHPNYYIVVKSATEADKYCIECGLWIETLPIVDGNIPACTAHRFVTWKQTKAPTCTTKGETKAYCSDCGHVAGTDFIDMLEHKAGIWTVTRKPRTYCTGLNEIKCTVCSTVLDSKTLPKLEIEEGADAFSMMSDVMMGEWYYDAVKFAVNNEFFNGIDAGTFGPNQNMTRAMFVTVLGRLAGVEVDNNVKTPFTDVKRNQYYTGYVKWANENGIINGTTKTTFSPNKDITREEICAIIVRYAKYAGIKLNTAGENIIFRDADEISKYAVGAVLTCNKAGIVKGRGDNYFAPKATATRAEIAQVLKNLCMGYLVVE